MENDHLGFACPRCGAGLVVPALAAGVEGPCPRCGVVIRAPRLTGAPQEAPVRLEVPAEPPVKAKPVTHFQPAAEQPVIESTVVRANRRAGLLRTSAVILLLALITTVLVLVSFPTQKPLPAAVAANEEPKPQVSGISLAPSAAPQPNRALDTRVPPEGMDVRVFVTKSAGVLGEFLTAGNLEKRLPLMETATPREELEKSVLAGDLKANGKFESLEVRFDKVEGASEVLFKGEFEDTAGTINHYLVLVRTRGSQQPKIVVDPFLDTFGGRFAAFAAAPREGEQKFRIIATVFEFCSDPEIPDQDLKYTMKISSCPGAADLAKAYFGKLSPLREKLEKMGVRYGRGAGAHVTLRWNTSARPYIEVVDVTGLDWSD